MNKNNLNQNLFSIIILSFLFVFIGCGSFEGVSYYATDGIYNNDDSIKTQSENKKTAAPAGLSLIELRSPPNELNAPPIEVYLAEPNIPEVLKLKAS